MFAEITPADQECLLTIITDVHQQLPRLLDNSLFSSVRAICIFGTLKQVCSRISVSDKSLVWLIEHNQLLVELCRCFQDVCRKIGNTEGDLDIHIAEFLEKANSSECEAFVSFCQNLQTILRKWKEKVTVQEVTMTDIEHLRKQHKWFNVLCDAVYVQNACISEEEVEQLLDGYKEIKTGLSDILLQHLPCHSEIKW